MTGMRIQILAAQGYVKVLEQVLVQDLIDHGVADYIGSQYIIYRGWAFI
jgi:hypothetical protein